MTEFQESTEKSKAEQQKHSRLRRSWLQEIFLFLLIIILLGLLSLAGARLLGQRKSQRKTWGDKLETVFADLIEESIHESGEVLETPEITAFLTTLEKRFGNAIESLSSEKSTPSSFRILVVDNPSVNAMALPGNVIILYSGLFHALEESESLAAVLAHEIGHVWHNDLRNALIREMGLSLFLGIGSAGGAEKIVGKAIRQMVHLRYSRQAEKRADVFAIDLMALAQLNPQMYTKALKALQKSAEETPEWARYLDAHPLLETRINDAETQAQAKQGDYVPLQVDWEELQSSLPSMFDP